MARRPQLHLGWASGDVKACKNRYPYIKVANCVEGKEQMKIAYFFV